MINHNKKESNRSYRIFFSEITGRCFVDDKFFASLKSCEVREILVGPSKIIMVRDTGFRTVNFLLEILTQSLHILNFRRVH